MPRQVLVLMLCVWCDVKTYQPLEDTLARCRAAGLDLPYVVLCDLVELELVRDLLWSHSWTEVSTDSPVMPDSVTYPLGGPACLRTPAAARPSFLGPG